MTRYAPQWLQAGSYAGSQDRRLISAIWPAPASSGCAVTAATVMTVNIAAGQVAVPSQNNTGSTLCTSDAVEQVTLTAAPASGTNRIDVVTCHPRGNDLDGGSNNDFLFDFVTGTAAATPTVPATPAGQVALAQIYVAGGSASVTAGNITDVRPGGLSTGGSGAGSGPRGYVASIVGPASQVDGPTSPYLSLSAPLIAGRRYRFSASTSVTCSAVFTGYVGVSSAAGYLVGTQRLLTAISLPSGQFQSGAGVFTFAATATATDTFVAISSGTGVRIGANYTWLAVEDIGST